VLEGHTISVFQSHFRLMADASSLAQVTNWCGYGIHQQERCRMCSKATRIQSSSVAFSPDGRLIISGSSSGSSDNSVWVWDSSTGGVQNVLKGHTNCVGQSHFPLMEDTLSLAHRTNQCGYGIHQRERCRMCLKATQMGSCQSHFRLMADALSLAHRQHCAGMGFINRRDAECARRPHNASLISCIFRLMADIVSGSFDNSVRVWDSATGEVQNVLEGHTNWVHVSCIFILMADASSSGSSDNTVRVWDSSTGEVQNMLKGHTIRLSSVAFSPDGRHIVSGS
jgi:WD40 repeat protein